MATEVVIYQDGNVTITPTRAMLGEKTYTIAHITSVSLVTIPPNEIGTYLLWLLGLALFVPALPGLAGGFSGPDYSLLALPAIFVIAGVLSIAMGVKNSMNKRPSYALKIESASGNTRAMVAPDLARMRKIEKAINEAIVRRG